MKPIKYFVIPMAGIGSRFKNCGITAPKYSLKFNGDPVFYLNLKSFKEYFHDHHFVFLINISAGCEDFIRQIIDRLENEFELTIKYDIVQLNFQTSGPAETFCVGMQSLDLVSDFSVMTSPVDLFYVNPIRERLEQFLDCIQVCDLKETHWAYVQCNQVCQVTHISKLVPPNAFASTGLYKFSNGKYLLNLAKTVVEAFNKNQIIGEPSFEHIINLYIKSHDMNVSVVDVYDIIMLGTPKEFDTALTNINLSKPGSRAHE